MKKIRTGCPPYEGTDPYLYFCFAEKDREAVFPLLEYLYLRGVRIWYNVENTADIRKLNRQQERMNQASLLVIYLTENARNDERVKNSPPRWVKWCASICGSIRGKAARCLFSWFLPIRSTFDSVPRSALKTEN